VRLTLDFDGVDEDSQGQENVAVQASDRGEEPNLRLFTMRAQKRRELWKFIFLSAKREYRDLPDKELTNAHAAFAYCKRCNCSISFIKGKHDVLKHMQQFHSLELLEGEKERILATERKRASRSVPLKRRLDGAVDVSSSEKASQKQSLRVISPEQQQHVNRLLARWVSRHFRPLVMVEDDGFIEFVRYITVELGQVRIDLPRRTQLRRDIIVYANSVRELVKQAIQRDCKFYSITSDIWTSRNSRSYISCTLHYVNENFVPNNWTLEVQELPGIHDGAAISAALAKILQRWSIPKAFCVKLVRDAGANMVKAGNMLGVDHTSCVAHALHLIVAGALIKSRKSQALRRTDEPEPEDMTDSTNVYEDDDSLGADDRAQMTTIRELATHELDEFLDTTLSELERDDIATVRGIVQIFRAVAVYFRKSPKARHRLHKIQVEELHVNPSDAVVLKVDCPTRWNSCWDMLQRFIRLKPALELFFSYLASPEGAHEFRDVHTKIKRPKAADWLTIKCLQTLLGPFAVATRNLSGQMYPTAPLVMPALSGIRVHLTQSEMFRLDAAEAGEESYVDDTLLTMNECRRLILQLFDSRFPSLQSSELMWVSYLDPRVAKRMAHLTAADTPHACAAVVRAAVNLARDESKTPSRPASDTSGMMLSPVPIPVDAESFMNDHMYGPDVNPNLTVDLQVTCEDELKRYLHDATVVNRAQDAFLWWRVNREKYPNLSRLARKWLGTVATSVPSERAFSTSGNIVTVKRSSLSSDLVRDLVFVSENSHIDQ
jgi:hypothetical protein